jgi:hypothetical protein
MTTRREYLSKHLELYIRPENIDSVLEYLLSIDLTSSPREEFEQFLLDVCGRNKEHEISLLVHSYFTAEFAESDDEEAAEQTDASSSAVSQAAQEPLQQWPRPLGGSYPKLKTDNINKSKAHISRRLEGASFTNPIALPSSSSTSSKLMSLDKIGVKVVRSKKNNNSKNSVAKEEPIRSECGCFATRHACIASCLSCGRIYCEREGPINANKPTTCFFCEAIVLPPLSAEEASKRPELNQESTIRAYQQKDKLLLFDKENAKRTQVLDSQADYYESSTWLTDEEKREIDEKERKRVEKSMVGHKKMHIAYDIAGRKFVQVDSDSEDETIISSSSKNVTCLPCDPMGHQMDEPVASLYQATERIKLDAGVYEDSQRIDSMHEAKSYDIRSSRAVNALALESSKAGVVYRKLISQLQSSTPSTTINQSV